MSDEDDITSGSSLEDFVKNSLEQIKKGAGTEFTLGNNRVEFELSATSVKAKGGEFNIKILGADIDVEKKAVQKIKFYLIDKDSSEAKRQEVIKKMIEEDPEFVLAGKI